MPPSSMTGERQRKPVIGIVGGIGAGKSTAAAEFAAAGCAVIDADAIGHDLLGDESVREALRRRWGERVFGREGKVDRQAVADIVFADPAELAGLNRIMHPRMRPGLQAAIAKALAEPEVRAAVLDAAVLLEAGWDEFCTHLVFVSAPESVRSSRVRSQRGWDGEAFERREKTQISLDKKAGKCDYTIDNSSSVSHLREQVREIVLRIVRVADRP